MWWTRCTQQKSQCTNMGDTWEGSWSLRLGGYLHEASIWTVLWDRKRVSRLPSSNIEHYSCGDASGIRYWLLRASRACCLLTRLRLSVYSLPDERERFITEQATLPIGGPCMRCAVVVGEFYGNKIKKSSGRGNARYMEAWSWTWTRHDCRNCTGHERVHSVLVFERG